MGQVSSAFDPDGEGVSIPENYTIPSFPSLYSPTIENTAQDKGYFLYDAEAIWRFTFYWTLIMMGGIFLACSVLAVFNLFFSVTLHRPSPPPPRLPPRSSLRSRSSHPLPPEPRVVHLPRTWRTQPKRKRPPIWVIALIPVAMVAVAAFVALISGTVVGFALAAIYSAGSFSVSTWVPFLWALIQVLVLVISSYSTLTSIL